MTHSTLAHTSAKAQNAVSTQVAAKFQSLISHAFWAVKGLNLLKIHAFSAFQALKMPTTQMKRARNFSLSLSFFLSLSLSLV